MNAGQRNLAHVAAELRHSFDAAFARAHAADPPSQLDLLQIQVGEHGYALRLAHVLAVHAERKLVPAPSRHPELLGLVGVRGVVAPVYDLRRLLGYSSAEPPRWLALVRATAPFAVGFEHFERHLRVPLGDLTLATAGDGAAHPFASGSVKHSGGVLPVIDLLAIFAEVTGKARPSGALAREERP